MRVGVKVVAGITRKQWKRKNSQNNILEQLRKKWVEVPVQNIKHKRSDQISRSACPTLCDPMNRSTPGLLGPNRTEENTLGFFPLNPWLFTATTESTMRWWGGVLLKLRFCFFFFSCQATCSLRGYFLLCLCCMPGIYLVWYKPCTNLQGLKYLLQF